MFGILYDVFALVFLLAFSPVYLYRMITRKKYRVGFLERWGFYPKLFRERVSQGRWIWLHAVSLGEVNAARPLIDALRRRLPEYRIAVSTVTDTGQNQARNIGNVHATFYLPLDFGPAVDRLLRFFRPELMVIMETELWPRVIHKVSGAKIPIALANGRISDRSFPRYRLLRFVTRSVFRKMALVGVQAEQFAERARFLGAPFARVKVFGNLKFDAVTTDPAPPEELDHWNRVFRFAGDEVVIIGGSTWPGEEEALVEGYEHWLKTEPRTRLILAPRHPNRLPEIRKRIEAMGFPYLLRSDGEIYGPTEGRKPPIRILDTTGELFRVYALGTVAFVGKSLFEKEGQNPLEPAARGCAVFFGPNMRNFPDVAPLLVSGGGARAVRSPGELRAAIDQGLQNVSLLREAGHRARRVAMEGQGVAGRIVEALAGLVEGKSG